MGRVRVCGARCHEARGTHCKCVCSGFFHGKDGAGASNREALAQAVLPKELLKQHGFKKGATRYMEQRKLPMEVINA